MKSAQCISTLDLGEFERWPAGDPRRAHLRSCPRCQAELASYREFVQPPDQPAGARTEDAARSMRAAFGAELRRHQRHSVRWPAYAVAAAAAVALLAVLGPWRAAEDLGPLRAGEPSSTRAAMELGAVTSPVDGSLTLHWLPVMGADAYRLHLFDAELREIGTATTTKATQVQVPASAERPRAWQVVALRAGVRIAGSELVALP